MREEGESTRKRESKMAETKRESKMEGARWRE